MVKQRSTARRYHSLLALGLALLPAATAAGAAELAGSEWRPVRIGASDLAADTKAFVQFRSGGELVGQGGCNRFFGRYKIEGETIEIGPIGATRMACPEPVMAEEASFLAALEAARTWTRDRTSLVLFDAEKHEQARLQQTDAD